MNHVILAAGATLLTVGGVCLAVLPFTAATWLDVAQLGVVLGFLSVGIAAAAFVVYPLAKAEAKVRECQGCGDDGQSNAG